MSAVFVVIPALNEGPVLGGIVTQVRARGANVVVIDDGSLDDTAAVARAAGAAVISHPFNLGQGAALQTGISYALARGARYIVTFDADGQHDPDDIPMIVARLAESGADVAFGSRFLGRAVGMSLPRKLAVQGARVVDRMLTGANLSDSHNGVRAFTREAASRIDITQDRMAHASEILAQVVRQGLRWIEVPVTVTYSDYSRAKGQKLSGALRILLDLLAERLSR